MRKQSLYIYKIDAHGNKLKFPNETVPAKLGEYTYTAQRMAGTPTLTATLNYPTCLDEEWMGEEFVEFRGERYYVGQVPTSSKDNKSIMYKHELQFVSERIVLENVYFMDVVTEGSDTYQSNSTSIKFMGDINEFVARLNASMKKSGIGYSVVIDDGIKTESKLVTLDKVYIVEALKNIYTIYDLPYYFVGKVCHIGYTENVINTPFEYRKGLVSIKKENANYKIVNRVTGEGSSENIPFYYPNNSQDGDIDYATHGFGKDVIREIDYELLKKNVPDFLTKEFEWTNIESNVVFTNQEGESIFGIGNTEATINLSCSIAGLKGTSVTISPEIDIKSAEKLNIEHRLYVNGELLSNSNFYTFVIKNTGETNICILRWVLSRDKDKSDTIGRFSYKDSTDITGIRNKYRGWTYIRSGKTLFLDDKGSGIYVGRYNELINDCVLTFEKKGYIQPSQTLMPSIYRRTGGAERFYNALNDTYKIPGTNDYYTFKNTYSKNSVKEIKVDFNDIKPTIEGVKNLSGQLFGEIADIAFDINDNDEVGTGTANNVFNGTDEYVHSYFYIKLNIYDGPYGFNLFEQGLEGGTAFLNMTTGSCAACEFEIGVTYKDDEPGRAFNPVLLDTNGNLPEGDFEQKVTSDKLKYVDRQQDTYSNSVWIAVKKDNTSYPDIMPNATKKYRPKKGDKFVITGIKMPNTLVAAAEDRLEEELIKYMSENNDEKFTFSLTLSRVFLANNAHVADILNENARIYIKYNKKEYLLYVNSFTCKADKNCLYDISVELTDKLSANISALRSTITEIAGDVVGSILQTGNNNSDWLARASRLFINKNKQDYAEELIGFKKGLETGYFAKGKSGGNIDGEGNAELLSLVIREALRSPNFRNGMTGEGFRLWLNSDGLAELELDKLTVRQIMTVFELIIERIKAVGGQIIVSAANGKIKAVEDAGDSYAITLEGDNYFQPHDLMRCQVFSLEESRIHGYWVEVLDVDGSDVIVAKSEFEGQTPLAGDEVVLFGNTQNSKRQNLISISATEDGEPRIDVLDGVNSKALTDALRARLGNLDGISDGWFPEDNQPHGDGLYSDNAYLRGTFLLVTGEDIKTKFEIVEGKIRSSIESLRDEIISESYLSNGSFADGLSKWNGPSDNNVSFFTLGDKWIWSNGRVLSKKGDGVFIVEDEDRRMMRIKNSSAIQRNADFKSKPSFTVGDDGLKEAVPVYLTFFYKCEANGILLAEFENVDKTGFHDFDSFRTAQPLLKSDGYARFSASGLWNGTGDFKLQFAGGAVRIGMVVLSTDRVEGKYRTLFEQSEKLVKIAAENFDSSGKVLEKSEIITTARYNTLISQRFSEDGSLKNTSGLVTKPDGSGIFAQGPDGRTALIGVLVTEDGKSVIKLTSDNIQLEGLVTANGNFKILEDGSIESANGKFSGNITATSGRVGSFDITEDAISCGNDKFFTRFQALHTTKSITINGGINSYVPTTYVCQYFENRHVISINENAGTGKYDWRNVVIADVMNLSYFSQDVSTNDTSLYGFQYAMLGSGHLVLDGMVEGCCLDKIIFSANDSIKFVQLPFYCNRIAVDSNYDRCIVALPDKLSIFATIGCSIITSIKSRRFSYMVTFINTGSKVVYISGRSNVAIGSGTPLDVDSYPALYSNGKLHSGARDVAIQPYTTLEILLVFDGLEYFAFVQ